MVGDGLCLEEVVFPCVLYSVRGKDEGVLARRGGGVGDEVNASCFQRKVVQLCFLLRDAVTYLSDHVLEGGH